MRAYVVPFALGIWLGMLVAFLLTSLPDPWILNTTDYGTYLIPNWDSEIIREPTAHITNLTNQALLLRFSAFMLQEGYWYLAIPTIITCGYTRLRMEARRSANWNRLFATFDWMLAASTIVTVFLSTPSMIHEHNPLECFLTTCICACLLQLYFWGSVIGPLALGAFTYSILAYRDSRPEMPLYRFANPGFTL